MADTAQRLWGVIEPYVAAEGIELDDIELQGGGGAQTVRIVVDSPEAIDVERIAELSRGISRLLDTEDLIDGSYTLEVSSPGLERKLRRPRHFEKSIGREVRVKTFAPVGGDRLHRGRLVSADDEGFDVEIEGTPRRIAYDDVASARTVFVWEKGAKPGKKRSRRR